MLNNNVFELRAILDEVSDGVVMLNGGGGINWSNAAFKRFASLAGFNSGGGLFELFSGDDKYRLRQVVEQVCINNAGSELEVFFPDLNLWFLLKVTPAAGGVIVVFCDITHSKDNRDVVIDERNLRILINITDHPIWLVDMTYNIVVCNDAFKKWVFNFAGKELGNGDNVLAPELDALYLEKLKVCYELASTGKHFTAIEDIKMGGEVKFTTINFNPVFDKNGVLTGISCHASDITDHRKNLSKIESQTQLLMEIANIQSHKVRGPVATLLGLVHIFNFEDIGDPCNREVMSGVAEVTEKLDEIVREVIRSINLLSYRNSRTRE